MSRSSGGGGVGDLSHGAGQLHHAEVGAGLADGVEQGVEPEALDATAEVGQLGEAVVGGRRDEAAGLLLGGLEVDALGAHVPGPHGEGAGRDLGAGNPVPGDDAGAVVFGAGGEEGRCEAIVDGAGGVDEAADAPHGRATVGLGGGDGGVVEHAHVALAPGEGPVARGEVDGGHDERGLAPDGLRRGLEHAGENVLFKGKQRHSLVLVHEREHLALGGAHRAVEVGVVGGGAAQQLLLGAGKQLVDAAVHGAVGFVLRKRGQGQEGEEGHHWAARCRRGCRCSPGSGSRVRARSRRSGRWLPRRRSLLW